MGGKRQSFAGGRPGELQPRLGRPRGLGHDERRRPAFQVCIRLSHPRKHAESTPDGGLGWLSEPMLFDLKTDQNSFASTRTKFSTFGGFRTFLPSMVDVFRVSLRNEAWSPPNACRELQGVSGCLRVGDERPMLSASPNTSWGSVTV